MHVPMSGQCMAMPHVLVRRSDRPQPRAARMPRRVLLSVYRLGREGTVWQWEWGAGAVDCCRWWASALVSVRWPRGLSMGLVATVVCSAEVLQLEITYSLPIYDVSGVSTHAFRHHVAVYGCSYVLSISSISWGVPTTSFQVVHPCGTDRRGVDRQA